MVSLFGGVVGFCICLSHWESNFGRSTGRFAFSLDLFGCVVFFCWICWFGHLSVNTSLYGFCSMTQQKRCSELPGKKHDPAIMLEPLARNVSHVLPHTAPGSRTRLPSRIQLHSDFRSVQMASLFGCVVGLCVCLITWKSNFGCWSRWWRARRIDLEVRWQCSWSGAFPLRVRNGIKPGHQNRQHRQTDHPGRLCCWWCDWSGATGVGGLLIQTLLDSPLPLSDRPKRTRDPKVGDFPLLAGAFTCPC